MNNKITPQELLQQMAQIQQMERGKLCVIRQGPEGPYYSHQTWENGKNTSRYVPRPEVEAVEQAIAGHQKFATLTDQYVQLMVEKTRQERAVGVKKRPGRRNPPRPRPGNPRVDAPVSRRPTLRDGGSGVGGADPPGRIQIRQPAGGLAVATSRRPG
jgi:hypothetical protein